MGKKGTKRKTQWRTLSITEQDEINAAAAASKGNYNNGINIDEASPVDDNFKYSGTNYSYLKRKSSSSFNSSSNLYNNNNNNININNNNNNNNNIKYRNDYRNSDSNLNSYYNSNKQHNNNNNNNINNDTTTITNNNSNIITTANNRTTTNPINSINYHYNSNNNNNNNNINNNYNNTSSSRYSYRRRPYSMQQNGNIGGGSSSSSSKYYSSYGAGRATSRPNRSYNDTTTAISNKENDYPKPCFNEDEYTRITTPRQDVIFKKGYFSRPRPYLSSNTDTNTTSSAAASVVSNEESISAASVPSSLSPEQCSSSQSDSIPDQEHTFMYSYVDQNGIVYVNPYMPNGFDQYSGQMFMMPYGYSPYNIFPPDLNTPPLNENDLEENENKENINDVEITDNSDDKIISDNLSNKEEELNDENDTNNKIENISKSDLDNCDSVDDTSNTEESSIEPKYDNIEKNDQEQEGYINNESYTNINNHCQPNFINFGGFGGQYYPPMFYPLNMYNGQPLMPIIGGPNYDIPMNIVEQDAEDDGDDSDQSINCTQTNRNRIRRDIQQHTHRNSTGATTTDYSEEECSSDTDDVTQTICEPIVKQELDIIIQEEEISENKSCDNKLNDDDIDKTNDDEEICSSITQETDNKQIKFNANVKEFKPRIVVEKPHLNVNVKEFLPRSYQTDSTSSSSLDHNDSTIKSIDELKSSLSSIDVKEISNIENPEKICVNDNQLKHENETSQQQEKAVIQKSEKSKIVELTLAEKIKLNLMEENKNKIEQSTILENDQKKDSKQILPRDIFSKRNNKITKKLDKTSLKFHKKKLLSSYHENITQIPKSPSKISISSSSSSSSSHEVQKSNNVLSYAQMVNKDLNTKLPNEISKSSTTEENNPANNPTTNTKDIDDEINIQILLKSLDAADNLTAAKENITWQTVKPKGKRGKNYKDDEIDETEPENTTNDNIENQIELVKKTKSLVNDNKKKQIIVTEEPIKIEETLPIVTEEPKVNVEEIDNTTTDEIKITEKKKSKSKNKKSSISSSTKKTSTKSSSKSHKNHNEKNDNKDDTTLNTDNKTDKPDEDATNLARRLFEEIDLSLKTTPKESTDDDDLILGEIYSPNSNLMNKTFGRNPLDIMNVGFYKNTSILKEEEEMVLNVIKSLSSNSNSASPIGGNSNKNSFNIFNASFIEGIGKTVQRSADLGLKKTSTTENLDIIMGNNDKQHVKLSTSEKKHNKLGISRRTGKNNNADKQESKNDVTKNIKIDDETNNYICEQPLNKNDITTEDSTEITNLPSPKINSDEKINNIDSSEYIKNCIQESFKWIEKSHIPKFTKTIEEHLINTSTIENIASNGKEIDCENIKDNNIIDIVKEPPEILDESVYSEIDNMNHQIVEEIVPEEEISIETPNYIQDNSNTELEMIKLSDTDEIILNEDSIEFVEENCQENEENNIEPLVIQDHNENEGKKEKDFINSNGQLRDEIQNENCENEEGNAVDRSASKELHKNCAQDSLIENISSKVPDHDISQCNGNAPNEKEEFVISKKPVENEECAAYIDKSQLSITKNIEENLKMNHQTNECPENGINNCNGKVVTNGIDNLKTNQTYEEHNGLNTDNFVSEYVNGHETEIQVVNGFHKDITEETITNSDQIAENERYQDTITQTDKIIENGENHQPITYPEELESTKISNEKEISKKDIIISEIISPCSNNINTLITPLNIIESSDHNNTINNHFPKSYEIFDNNSPTTLYESFEDNINCKPRRYDRESSTSSSTSLEIQLKMLQEQLMKFDDITIKPNESSNQIKENKKLLSNHNDYEDNSIIINHSSILNTNNQNDEIKLELQKNYFDDNPEIITTTIKPIIVEPSSSSSKLNLDLTKSDSFPIESSSSSLILEKFPLTQAVKLWLDKESKENSPEPLLRIPNDAILSSLIKSSISQQSLDQYNDDEDDDYNDEDDTYSLSDNEHETNINVINDKKLINQDDDDGGGGGGRDGGKEGVRNDENNLIKNGAIKTKPKHSKNLKSNPLHVSSVNKDLESSIITTTTTLFMDNDSDYNSDSQLRYDDDNNTCERVAKNLSDLINKQQQQQQNNNNNKYDLLEYWDDEFIKNPKKYLIINKQNNINNNNDEQQSQKQQKSEKFINYENNNDSLLSSGCPSISSQNDLNNLIPYESVYGKTINYNQLLLNNNYEFLSNNIINNNNNNNNNDVDNDKNIMKMKFNKNNNDTLLNNNNFDNNNINNNNNCLKPPEVCCILM